MSGTTDLLYENFSDPTNDFLIEPRAFCYDVALGFIDKAKKDSGAAWRTSDDTIRGILLLLFTWNFAARETKALTYDNIRQVLMDSEESLKRLDGIKIEDDILSAQWGDILKAFSCFKELMGQTGASKALSLMNPDLFVMWDTKIRKRLNKCLIPNISNGEEDEHYITFLKGIKSLIDRYELARRIPPGASLAKKIDEFNYAKLIMNG
jgi:hypothetical protein